MFNPASRSLSPDFGPSTEKSTPLRTLSSKALATVKKSHNRAPSSKYRSMSQLTRKDPHAFEMRQNTLGRDSVDTSYTGPSCALHDLEAKLFQKNEAIKSQKFEIDHLQRKLKRLAGGGGVGNHLRRNSSLTPGDRGGSRIKKLE